MRQSQLKILAAVFANLAAAWYFTLPATRDIFVMVGNLFFGTLALVMAFRLEEAAAKNA